MEQDKIKLQEIIKVIGFILLFVAFYMGLVRVDAYLKAQAINDCGKISKYERQGKGETASYPVLEVYNSCLKDKGINK